MKSILLSHVSGRCFAVETFFSSHCCGGMTFLLTLSNSQMVLGLLFELVTVIILECNM